MIFEESGLLFEFEGDWDIRKYDSHKYYKILAGTGLKGIDFLGIHNKQELYLFEVKNYKIRNEWQTSDPMDRIRETPEELAEKIIQKIEDSLRLFRVIYLYYRRKWMYRHLFPVVGDWWPGFEIWKYWTRVYQLSQEKENIRVVFWMETTEKEEELKSYLLEKIQQSLSLKASQIILTDSHSNPFTSMLSVQDAKNG
jgi:hypothetical protein